MDKGKNHTVGSELLLVVSNVIAGTIFGTENGSLRDPSGLWTGRRIDSAGPSGLVSFLALRRCIRTLELDNRGSDASCKGDFIDRDSVVRPLFVRLVLNAPSSLYLKVDKKYMECGSNGLYKRAHIWLVHHVVCTQNISVFPNRFRQISILMKTDMVGQQVWEWPYDKEILEILKNQTHNLQQNSKIYNFIWSVSFVWTRPIGTNCLFLSLSLSLAHSWTELYWGVNCSTANLLACLTVLPLTNISQTSGLVHTHST